MATRPPAAIITSPGSRGSLWTVQRLRTGSRLPVYYKYAVVGSESTALEIYEKCLGGEVPK